MIILCLDILISISLFLLSFRKYYSIMNDNLHLSYMYICISYYMYMK